MNVAAIYSKERTTNLYPIMATYGRVLRVGDAVQLGNPDDSQDPYAKMNERPYGRVASIHGPPDARVINVKLEGKNAGSWAHCDTLSLNPFLTLSLPEKTYQNALHRFSDKDVERNALRAQHDAAEVAFRGLYDVPAANASLSYRGASSSGDIEQLQAKFRGLEQQLEEMKTTVAAAVKGLGGDIAALGGGSTYAGRMLHHMGEDDDEVRFGGLQDSDFSDVDED